MKMLVLPRLKVKVWVTQGSQRVLCHSILVQLDACSSKLISRFTYTKEIVDTESQIAALGKGIHHQKTVDMQSESIRE